MQYIIQICYRYNNCGCNIIPIHSQYYHNKSPEWEDLLLKLMVVKELSLLSLHMAKIYICLQEYDQVTNTHEYD